MSLHWLDIAIIAVVALSVLTGLFRGFVKEVVALAVWIVAIWLALNYSSNAEPWLQTYIHDKRVLGIAAFLLVLIASLIVGGLFNAFLGFILKRSGLSSTDRILGMFFGFARGLFIVALFILVMNMTSMPLKQYSEQSIFYAKFDPLVAWLSTYVPDMIKEVKSFDLDKADSMIGINPSP